MSPEYAGEKKMGKKIVTLVLCSLMVLSCTVSAFADSMGPSGDSMVNSAVTIEQQEADVLNDSSLSAAKKLMFKKKFEAHRLFLAKDLARNSNKANSMVTINATTNPSGTIAVPYYKQANGYYCGPATTRQTVSFIKGSASSQSVIAAAIGTTTAGSDLTPMKNYVNSVQSRNAYVITTSPTESYIQFIAEYGVSESAPPMARLRFSAGTYWKYPTSGHFMSISGYKSYGESIRVTDPYIGWVDESAPTSYYVSSYTLYKATADHPAHQMSY